MEVRDPIHGTIELSEAEARLVHTPFVQRLRGIRQIGYSSIPFPSATHTRFSHCLGVMHLAGLAFDRAYRGWTFDHPQARERFRAATRLAALCHDLGHAPYSHCTEFAMPPISQLGIEWYRSPLGDRRASHEDYTIAILQRTLLARVIGEDFPCTARHVAALISPEVPVGDDYFRDDGLDHRRLLSQIISSELDVDRLDYLCRDAYFSGARYGTVDAPWLLSSLSAHAADGQVWLALDAAALYAFEDFLVSRHHMFLQVYFHHKSVVYERMLERYVNGDACTWSVPADPEGFLRCDDADLEVHLRRSGDPWARRIVGHEPYRRVVERHGPTPQVSVEREVELLRAAGIDALAAESTGMLSRYAPGRNKRESRPIYVRDHFATHREHKLRSLRDASSVFERYAGGQSIARVYVAPEDREQAWAVLGIREER
jgi:HD superfamily phosphohydrolase